MADNLRLLTVKYLTPNTQYCPSTHCCGTEAEQMEEREVTAAATHPSAYLPMAAWSALTLSFSALRLAASAPPSPAISFVKLPG